MKRQYFKICAICGAHLDPGEVCDCEIDNLTSKGCENIDGSGEGSKADLLPRILRETPRKAARNSRTVLGA